MLSCCSLAGALVLLITILLHVLTNRHARLVALKADDDRLARAPDAVELFRSDLHTLSDVAIAEAAELWTNQVFDRMHLGIEELVGFVLCQLKSRIALLELFGELLISLHCSGRLECVFLSLRRIVPPGHLLIHIAR